MKTLISFFLTTILAITVFGQTETEIISKAKDLVDNKKYASAFDLLQKFDAKNELPEIVLMKENIALNYFVSSIMHELFAFKDLEKNEDIMDYRGKEGNFSMYEFSIDSVLLKLIKRYPKKYELYKGLGDFYYNVLEKYQGSWLIDDSTLANLIVKNYKKVIDHNLADYLTYYVVGLELLTGKKEKESIPYFLKSIDLKNDYPDADYNLAYAYLFTKDKENAIKYAKISFELYKSKAYKGDAARMLCELYTDLKDDQNAIKYIEAADSIETNNYYTLKTMLAIYLKTGNPKFKETLTSFYNLAPEKPTIYNDLGDFFFLYNKTPELIEFYKSQIPKYKDDKKVLGNLNFYLGQIYRDIDKKASKSYFLTAKEIFSTIFEKDNDVFQTIDQAVSELGE